MPLYYLERLGDVCWDEANSFVIRAPSSKKAREIAARNKGNESEDNWTNPKRSSCTEISESGDSTVICSDFKQG